MSSPPPKENFLDETLTVNCGSFQANATNVSLVGGAGRGNLSSTLTPTAPTSPGTVVTCSDPLVSQLPPQQSRPYPNVTGNYDYKLVCGCILYYYAYFSMCTLSRSSISPQRKIPSVVMVTTNQISLHVLYYVDYAQKLCWHNILKPGGDTLGVQGA